METREGQRSHGKGTTAHHRAFDSESIILVIVEPTQLSSPLALCPALLNCRVNTWLAQGAKYHLCHPIEIQARYLCDKYRASDLLVGTTAMAGLPWQGTRAFFRAAYLGNFQSSVAWPAAYSTGPTWMLLVVVVA